MKICLFGVGGVGGYFGALVTARLADLHTIKSVLTESKIDFSYEEEINISIWSKFIFIAAYGLIKFASGIN